MLTCLYTCQAFSQATTNGINGPSTFQFELQVEAPIYHADILGRQLDTTVYIAPKGAVFYKIGTKGSNVIIRFWVWKNDTTLMEQLNYVADESNIIRNKYFLLSLDEFNAKAIPRYNKQPSFTLGAAAIPLRIRSNPFDYSGDFSFGTSFGAKFPLADYQDISLNLTGGLHLTSITLDSLDTNGKVRSTASTTTAALTPLLGAVFEFSKAQVGFYLGWDFINGVQQKNWIYQGKPWFSIGAGISLFNTGANASLGGLGNDSQ